jgi:hypothetical protein
VSWELPDAEAAAFHGLAGSWSEAVTGSYTEGARVGVLVSTLVAFGNAVNRGPHMEVGATRHRVNEFALLIGKSAVGRKGEAHRAGIRPIQQADTGWQDCVKRGFGSGEALVEEVRDPQIETDTEGKETVVDPGSGDRRALIWEDEFAHMLAVVSREGLTYSPLLRSGWDGSRLENRTKGRKLIATTRMSSSSQGSRRRNCSARSPRRRSRTVSSTATCSSRSSVHATYPARHRSTADWRPTTPVPSRTRSRSHAKPAGCASMPWRARGGTPPTSRSCPSSGMV